MRKTLIAVALVAAAIVVCTWFYRTNIADNPPPDAPRVSIGNSGAQPKAPVLPKTASALPGAAINQAKPSGMGPLNPPNEAVRRSFFARQIERREGPLLDFLPLDNEKKVALRKLLLERSLEEQDARAASATAHLSSQETQEAIAQATSDSNNAIASLLGPEENEQWTKLEQVSETYQYITSGVGLDMSFAGVPLSPAQELQLAEAMKDANYGPSAGPHELMSAMGIAPSLGDTFSTVLNQVAGSLSPQQLDVLKQSNADKQAQDAVIAKMAKQLSEK